MRARNTSPGAHSAGERCPGTIAGTAAAYLRTYILPYFDNTALADLRALEIEGFQSWLLKQPCRGNEEKTLSPTTCNHVVQAFRLITKWAIRQRVLTHDPFVGVESLAMQPKRRGIFTMEEVKQIFAAVLLIDASWERSGRLKTPKSGKSRLVPVPPVVYSEMLAVLDASPWKEPDHFLFYSADPKKPMSHKKIDTDFARALHAAGIDEKKRRERVLSFHSWRHWSNSFLVNKGLPPLRAQQVIGHTSLKMTANYLHTGQNFSDVLKITGELFK